jgi:putative transposase
LRLTIQAGIINLTKRKQQLLDREYTNLQLFLKGKKDVQLYSANKQQALRYYKVIKPNKEYPISLRNTTINLKKAKRFWFLKIPVAGQRGGIKVPIKPHRDIPSEGKLCESKLIQKDKNYIVMLTFDIPTPSVKVPSSILAVDLGERFPATAVLLQNGNVMKPMFLGKEIRGIRRHYGWIRTRLQEKGLLKDVKRIGRKEHRIVNNVLHKISKAVVSLADQTNSCIVLGDLKGIRKQRRGKRLNRIVSNIPYYRLSQMIAYKATMKGIPVITTNEAYTSRTCHICGCEGKRKTQGLFVCPYCGEYNADLNGAINIGKKVERWLGYMPFHGAEVSQPLTVLPSAEAFGFSLR